MTIPGTPEVAVEVEDEAAGVGRGSRPESLRRLASRFSLWDRAGTSSSAVASMATGAEGESSEGGWMEKESSSDAIAEVEEGGGAVSLARLLFLTLT